MSGNPYQRTGQQQVYATQQAYQNEYERAQAQKQAYDKWLAQKQAYEQWQAQNKAYEEWKIRQRAEELKEQQAAVQSQSGESAEGSPQAVLRKLNAKSAREAIIMSEIIGKPVSKRKRGVQART